MQTNTDITRQGKERELAGLLVILRLWRLIKLVGGGKSDSTCRDEIISLIRENMLTPEVVAVGVGSWDESSVRLLEAYEAKIESLEQENQQLRLAIAPQ